MQQPLFFRKYPEILPENYARKKPARQTISGSAHRLFNRGRRIRTLINGFGDRHPTFGRYPYITDAYTVYNNPRELSTIFSQISAFPFIQKKGCRAKKNLYFLCAAIPLSCSYLSRQISGKPDEAVDSHRALQPIPEAMPDLIRREKILHLPPPCYRLRRCQNRISPLRQQIPLHRPHD